MNWIRRFLVPPVFEGDEDKTRAASLLNTILLAVVAIGVIYGILSLVIYPNPVTVLVATGVVVLLGLGTLFLMRRGRVQLTSVLLLSALWVIITLATLVSGGVRTPGFGSYTVIIVIAGLLLGGRAGIVFAGLSAVAGLGVLYAENGGLLPPPLIPTTPSSMWAGLTASFALTAVLLHLATRSIIDALERARSNERDLAESNRDLGAIRASLEERVAERTEELESSAKALAARGLELESTLNELRQREAELEEAVRLQEESYRELEVANEAIYRRSAQLQATAEVSRTIAQVRDPDALLSQVTQLISRHFGFYHVGVFLIDEMGRHAVLRATNSKGGQRMLARGHRLPVDGQSVVGYVASTRLPRIALDVGVDAAYLANPDLPETRSEMALPLRRGGEIIGVLDVQSTEAEAFSDEDVAVLETLADQISIVMVNAQLFSQVQAALAGAGTVQQQYLQGEWTRYVGRASDLRHEYLLNGWESLAGQPIPAGDEALAKRAIVARSRGEDEQGAALGVPIKLRDRVIGVLELQESAQDRQWTEEEVALVQAVVDRMAQALEAARLFEQTQARAQREQLVSRIASRMRAAPNVPNMLRVTAEELGRALGVSRSVARLRPQSTSGETE